jgi:urease accessory protein
MTSSSTSEGLAVAGDLPTTTLPVSTPTPAGRLEVGFEVDATGRSYIAKQFASYPFHICRAQYLDPELPDMASLYLQTSAGGVFEDDRLSLAIEAGEGARAHVTTQASTVVHSMPVGEARQSVVLEARPGSLLEYLPDPAILFPKARLRTTIRARVHEGASIILGDAFLPHDPAGEATPFGFLESETAVECGRGRLLALDRFLVEGHDLLAAGTEPVQGTLMAVTREVPMDDLLAALRAAVPARGDTYAGVSALPGGCGAWARVLARDGAALRVVLDALWAAARTRITGAPPAPRRK